MAWGGAGFAIDFARGCRSGDALETVNRFFEAVVAVRGRHLPCCLDGFHGRVMALPHHQISRRPGRFQRFESPVSTIVTTGSTIEVAGRAWRLTKERAGVSLSRLRACGPTSKRVTVVA